jgi:7,8-dihydropterin-6-yl-methyl-4-(beta-D-ribofuranosyl)aminobenzene 5'-phosphate synthase
MKLRRGCNRFVFWALSGVFGFLCVQTVAAQNRIIILNDAFGDKSAMEQDWGYSALIEFEGKRILFDTGDNIKVFQKNVEQLHVDLTQLDAVVISHSHGDHTSGLRYVLSKNPKVKLFVPDDPYFTGTVLPPSFLSTNATPELPARMRYFRGGTRPEPRGWVAWTDTNMIPVNENTTVGPHIRLVSLVSDKPAFKGLREISLVLDTPDGPVIIVGCSHPGIEQIMAEVTENHPKKPVVMLAGGLHLLQDSPRQIESTLETLANQYHVKTMAVGHCSGELAFLKIQRKWGTHSLYAGLGESFPF